MKKKGCLSRFFGWLFIASGIFGLFSSPIPGIVCIAIGVLFLKPAKKSTTSACEPSPASIQPKEEKGVPAPAPVVLPSDLSGVDGSTFGAWDISIHDAEGQDVRFDRAMFQKISIVSYDAENGSAQISGSHGDLYSVTLDGCTCQDFQRRRLPCKHIYKLAQSRGYSADAFFSARSDVVWYADGCRTYHVDPNCRGLKNRFSRRTTVAMAEYKGLRPCKSCSGFYSN